MRVSAADHIATPHMTAFSKPCLLAAACALVHIATAALAEPPEPKPVVRNISLVAIRGSFGGFGVIRRIRARPTSAAS